MSGPTAWSSAAFGSTINGQRFDSETDMIPIRDYNPTTRPPYVTYLLIAACILVFLWQLSLDPRSGQVVVHKLGFIPALLFGKATFGADGALVPSWTTLFTSMFLHGGLMHLGGNMLYLWIFGNNIEDVMGHGRFLVFYLLCGLAAAMAQALPDMESTVPMIGASGAISGVLGAYLLLFPKAKVQVIIPIGFFIMRTLPAGWLLGLWIAFQVISGIASDPTGGGVAWWPMSAVSWPAWPWSMCFAKTTPSCHRRRPCRARASRSSAPDGRAFQIAAKHHAVRPSRRHCPIRRPFVGGAILRSTRAAARSAVEAWRSLRSINRESSD